MRGHAFFVVAALALAAVGCSSTDSSPQPPPPSGPTDGLPAACNPLRANGACLLPYPSAVFLDEDVKSATGYRVHLALAHFPKNNTGTPYDPARMNRLDGFSPTGEILTYFEERLDGATLPPISDTTKSLSPKSATVIVDMATGKLVEHWSELDQQVVHDEDRQALIIRPIARLATGARYAVAVTNALHTLAGSVAKSPPGWASITAGNATDAMAVKQMKRMPDINAALAKAGVDASSVLVAWDFVTASDEVLTHTMRVVRERTLASKVSGYKITSVEDDFDQHTLRRVRGTFTVPKFLTQVDPAVADATLQFDASGDPIDMGTYEAPFTLILPRAAMNGPVKLIVFGHGFLGSGEGELGGTQGSYLQSFADAKGYALIATDWTGLSKYEGIDPSGSGAAGHAVEDINHVVWVSDRLHQAIANNIVLARTARDAIAKDPAFQVGGQQVIDTSRIDYFGISLGGVMGSALMGYAPDLERGVLNVGAAGWSTLFQRSTNWALFKLIVDGTYSDKLDQQELLEIFQAHFDPFDGMSIAPHVLADPLMGNPPKHILLQMGVNDVQVPNIATECYARTLGLPLLSDSPIDIRGLDKKAAPLSSALTAFDLHEPAPPDGNIAAPTDTMNTVHGEVRALPAVEAQIDAFLRTGNVESTCSGTCDPM